MARTVVGRVEFQVSRTPNLAAYGKAKLDGVPPIMQRSEARVKEAIVADTPVRTGHWRDSWLSTSDIADVAFEYQVFVRAQEFVGEVNPFGEIIQSFYPAILVAGPEARYPDLGTRQLEAERPRLLKELSDHFGRA